MPGRPRKSSAVRILEGNPGRRPIPKEPGIPRWDGADPEMLPPIAQDFYRSFAPRIREFVPATKLDEPAIVLMSSTWGLAMTALESLQTNGLTLGKRKNPAAQSWRENVSLFLQIASRFGMTPSDRARLFAGAPKKPVDQLADTLDGAWSERSEARPN